MSPLAVCDDCPTKYKCIDDGCERAKGRRLGHAALRVQAGRLEKFDPNPLAIDKPAIVDFKIYAGPLGKRVAIRYADDTEEDRPASALEEHLLSARPEAGPITQNDKRWRILEHGCQWVSFCPIGGAPVSFDPRDVKHRAAADEISERHLAILRAGIADMNAGKP